MSAWREGKGWLDYDPNDIFDRMQQELLEQERELRRKAEARADALHRVLYEVAKKVAPLEIDELRRKNPEWEKSVGPEAWQAFFEHVLYVKPRLRGWTVREDDEAERLQREVERLHQEAKRLEEELTRVRAEAARWREEAERLQEELERVYRRASSDVRRSASTRRPSSIAHRPTVELLPAPPTRFRKQIPQQKWSRVAVVVEALARGVALQREVAETLVARDERLNDPSSGSLKRLFAWMEKRDFVKRHVPGGLGLRWTVIWLSEKGSDLARTMGLEPQESEWARLMRLHGGKQQQGHALLVLLFAWQARKRGWKVEVCPDVDGLAEPDVLIEKGDERIFVEVEAESGTGERRMKKWQNIVDLQGFVALAAPDEGTLKRLVQEARAASEHGMATDIQALLDAGTDELWTKIW